jgi:hypothetical protein
MNETGEAILLLAVDRCNTIAVKQFFEVGASMEITDPKDGPTATALHSCILTGEIAQLLIDNASKTPLHQAIGWADASDAMATLLIHAGAGASQAW